MEQTQTELENKFKEWANECLTRSPYIQGLAEEDRAELLAAHLFERLQAEAKTNPELKRIAWITRPFIKWPDY